MRAIAKILPVIILPICLLLLGCGKECGKIYMESDGYGETQMVNGIKVLYNHDPSTSLSSGRFLIGGGVLTETADNNGITNLMTRMLLKGNDKMTASEITEQLDFLGANVSVSCFRDYSVISFTSLTEYFDQVLEIISQSLISPTFPEDELVKLKNEVKGAIKASNDSQSQASSKLFWKTAYGDRSYGLPTTGTEQSIARINAADIRDHFQSYVGGKNLIFSAASDLSVEQIEEIIENRLSDIKTDADTLSAPGFDLQNSTTGFIDFDRNQSFIYWGVMMGHLQANEVPYVILLNEIMGANVGSRLWYLRQKEKLAYAVYTQYATDKYGSLFRAAIGTDTSKVKIALESLNREWSLLVNEGITEDELKDAKVNMKNSMIYSIDRKSNRANNMAYYEYVGYNYRYPLDLIDMADRITLDQVNQFIKREFTEDRKYVSIVGKK